MYYTGVVYQHIHSKAALTQAGPEFSKMPQMKDFWIPIVSGIILFWVKKGITTFLHPYVKRVAVKLENETDELFDFKTGKAAAKAFNAIFHGGAALGAYLIMRGKPWHPWFLGGTGDFSDGFLNMPFSDMDYPGYIFGLVLFGHPV